MSFFDKITGGDEAGNPVTESQVRRMISGAAEKLKLRANGNRGKKRKAKSRRSRTKTAAPLTEKAAPTPSQVAAAFARGQAEGVRLAGVANSQTDHAAKLAAFHEMAYYSYQDDFRAERRAEDEARVAEQAQTTESDGATQPENEYKI